MEKTSNVVSLPPAFADDVRPWFPPAEWEAFVSAVTHADPQVSVRLNPRKTEVRRASLDFGDGIRTSGEAVPWCAEGFYLSRRPQFTLDPLLHAGVYYVQEASSMFVAHVLRSFVAEPVTMLDLCAAPGGKSTAALTALPEGSWLVSNEIDRRRARILAENVTKWGYPNVSVTANAPHDFAHLRDAFDVVLVDAPCSGEGMFRKDPDAIGQWSPRKVQECVATQRQILADIWPTLRPGGLLIYATCTYNVHEDEEMLAYVCSQLGGEALQIPTETTWGIHAPLTGTLPCCRFMPHTTRGEGHFMAAVRKAGEPAASAPRSKKNRGGRPPHPLHPQLNLDGLYVLQDGIEAGLTKGHDYIPSHAEALAVTTAPDAWPRVELDRETALCYLRREAIVLPDALADGTPTPRGHVIVTHRGHALGFVKNLGTRSNNLYPTEWRIRYV